MGDDRWPPAVIKYVLEVLEKCNCVEKLIAQKYNGASVMASEPNGVLAKRNEKESRSCLANFSLKKNKRLRDKGHFFY